MANKIFTVPFAELGDRAEVPDAVQPSGEVSYSQGYGPDYERPNTDPSYKPIGRQEWNGLMYDVTSALGEIQHTGAAAWDADAAPYPLDAMVYHDGNMWVSAIENNSATPGDGGDWAKLMGPASSASSGRVALATQAEVDAGASATKAVTPETLGQMRNRIIPFVQATGTANALVANFTPAITSLSNGTTIYVRTGASANTGLTTIDVNGLGPVEVLNFSHRGLSGGELGANSLSCFVYASAVSAWILLWSEGGLAVNSRGIRLSSVFNGVGRRAELFFDSDGIFKLTAPTTAIAPGFGTAFAFHTNGSVTWGTSNAPVTGSENAIQIGASDGGGALYTSRPLTTEALHMGFYTPNGRVGWIWTSGNNTNYATTSDYRLKNVSGPLDGSGEFIDALQPKVGSWRSDGSRWVGFIAHELQEVSPTSVSGKKDAIDKDGNPEYQSADSSSPEVMANIIAEMQSLRRRVAYLEDMVLNGKA